MADLTFLEKTTLETVLRMKEGYVLDLTRHQYAALVADSVGKDIYDEAYNFESGSKANRLRAFWQREPNEVVGTLLADLLAYARAHEENLDEALLTACEAIATRLKGPPPPTHVSKLVWKHKVGEGAHASVWEAEDDLGRRVAAKLFDASLGFMGHAIDHARALARVKHPNVVTVYFVHEVEHPTEKRMVTAIVMEYLEGDLLQNLLRGPLFTPARCRSIGTQILSGLKAIHGAGLTHGDLHEANIIIDGETVKIIDILYLETLDALTTTSKETRLKRDRSNLRNLLIDLLRHSDLDFGKVEKHVSALNDQSSLDDLERVFVSATDPKSTGDFERQLSTAFARFVDKSFVPSASYAAALADETADDLSLPLLQRIVSEGAARGEHRIYLSLLWSRLTNEEKVQLVAQASEVLDAALPEGGHAQLALLTSFGGEGWRLIPKARKLRIEAILVRDMMVGRLDIYGYRTRGGTLGKWVVRVGEHFEDRDNLVDTLCGMLVSDWYSQNYVGEYLMPLLGRLADSPPRESRLRAALEAAIRNDAKRVKLNLAKLPSRWGFSSSDEG